MKKTLTIVGERTWTGPLENYEVWEGCVVYWCNGGEVECLDPEDDQGYEDTVDPSFSPELMYRIKPREPKNGEVWIIDCKPYLYFDRGDGHPLFLQIDGTGTYTHDPHLEPFFAATSVWEYVKVRFAQRVPD